jgi:hypothetical protein
MEGWRYERHGCLYVLEKSFWDYADHLDNKLYVFKHERK